MATVIRVEGLSKKYLISHRRRPAYGTFRDAVSETARRLVREALRPLARADARPADASKEEFWALVDVSFEARQGERLGIIGRNGAGKTTLLKVLSRITEPSAGRISIKGRVASLLEVGTGFHPELTGRENIFLNGAILGMGRGQIRRRFDEIVAFAEVERFLDTPVKHYSSGMYVRLAFAVAAHLEPDILIVDEVLAVGDAQFQRKCLGKMEDVSNQGRTVLFVSHNMGAVSRLCSRALWLEEGRVASVGDVDTLTSAYLMRLFGAGTASLAERSDRKGNGSVRFQALAMKDAGGRAVSSFKAGETALIALSYRNNRTDGPSTIHLSLGFDDQAGQRVVLIDSETCGQSIPVAASPEGVVEVVIERLPLIPGQYALTVFCARGGEIADWVQGAGSIHVAPGPFFPTGRMPSQGVFLLSADFRSAG